MLFLFMRMSLVLDMPSGYWIGLDYMRRMRGRFLYFELWSCIERITPSRHYLTLYLIPCNEGDSSCSYYCSRFVHYSYVRIHYHHYLGFKREKRFAALRFCYLALQRKLCCYYYYRYYCYYCYCHYHYYHCYYYYYYYCHYYYCYYYCCCY